MEMQILFFLMSCHLLGLTEAGIFTFKTLKKKGGGVSNMFPSEELRFFPVERERIKWAKITALLVAFLYISKPLTTRVPLNTKVSNEP